MDVVTFASSQQRASPFLGVVRPSPSLTGVTAGLLLASPGGDHSPGRSRRFSCLFCVFRGMEPVSKTAALRDCEAWQPLFSYHLSGKSPGATPESCGVHWDHRLPGDAECSGCSILLLPSRAQIQQGVMTESGACGRHYLSR